MHVFKDTAGRTWSVQINVDAIKRVRALVEVDLLGALDGGLIEKLANDPIVLCDVLFSLVKPDADALNVTDVDFGRAMGGDAIEHATTALLEELVDFFPPGRRKILSKALAKLKALENKALTLAETRLDSPELDARLESLLTNAGRSSGN